MKIRDQLALGYRSLARHRLRSLLTMLGMIIGVSSVIVMTSLGLAARHQVEVDIARLGTHLLTVQAVSGRNDVLRGGDESRRYLTDDDARTLVQEIAGIRYSVPIVSGQVRLVGSDSNWQTTVIGTHPDYLAVRDWNTRAGRNFTMRDVTSVSKVVLIGRTVEKNLSPLRPLLGQVIRIEDIPFRVIGVLEEKGQSMNGQDQDDLIVAPISTVRSRLIGGYYGENRDAAAYLLMKGRNPDQLDSARLEIERILNTRHGVNKGAGVEFRIRDPGAALSASKMASETLTLLLASVAAVSLLVGGISIMNIMLVTVTERSREIGIRIALGATQHDIRNQFLLESSGIALVGGIIGVIVGATVASLINLSVGWRLLIDVWACLAAMSFSLLIGAASGLYPAVKASSQDPMDTIRQL
jgi:putative ABC transport system permease protein